MSAENGNADAKASLALVMQVWNDDTGDRIEVSEDRDGLGLMEIRYVHSDGKVGQDITLKPERAPLLIEAIQRVATYLLRDAKHTRQLLTEEEKRGD